MSLCYLGSETDYHHRNQNSNDRDHLVCYYPWMRPSTFFVCPICLGNKKNMLGQLISQDELFFLLPHPQNIQKQCFCSAQLQQTCYEKFMKKLTQEINTLSLKSEISQKRLSWLKLTCRFCWKEKHFCFMFPELQLQWDDSLCSPVIWKHLLHVLQQLGNVIKAPRSRTHGPSSRCT